MLFLDSIKIIVLNIMKKPRDFIFIFVTMTGGKISAAVMLRTSEERC